ncbi:hypothetical protein Plim_1737 [Planctopirus limnophila DSM 3776]|uniref:Uncharacterized protein n=2 Tax=Planctopirus limnophila TaxID=120 RepID=D5SXK0_PLAL2|nr:hypothetical protein Plim_1737 [Planctopirus limnophila DSM 3776]
MLASGIHAAARQAGLVVKQVSRFHTDLLAGNAPATGSSGATTGNSGSNSTTTSPGETMRFGICIVDLAMMPLPLSEIAAWCQMRSISAVAFGSHVAVDLLNAAREAGFAQVVPNSQLSRKIPEWLLMAQQSKSD